MCGRYQLSIPIDELIDLFSTPTEIDHVPRYNIAPTQLVPVIKGWGQNRTISSLRWGLVVPWSETPHTGAPLINARSETAHEKPSFRDSFTHKRCLVPATGFYEWAVQGKTKTPQLVKLKSTPVYLMAGLWSQWSTGRETIESFAILTTKAADSIAHIHERMPVILHPSHHGTWLNPTTPTHVLKDLCVPVPDRFIDVLTVSDRVNSIRNDDASCEQAGAVQERLL